LNQQLSILIRLLLRLFRAFLPLQQRLGDLCVFAKVLAQMFVIKVATVFLVFQPVVSRHHILTVYENRHRLNNRIVARLKFHNKMRAHAHAEFGIGENVSFQSDGYLT
jgi:hypothetical protein